jgi:hypothetical protein
MQYLDLLSDLRLFSSLSHVQKGFKRVKILSHNSQILGTSVFMNIFLPDIHKTWLEVIFNTLEQKKLPDL